MKTSLLSRTLRQFFALLVAVCALSAADTQAQATPQAVVGWETTGLSNYGPSPWAPTTLAANVTAVGLTRGAGVGTTGTAATSAWGGASWLGQADLPSAISAGAVVTFSVTPAAGFKFSLTSISPTNLRRSGTGPSTSQWQYRIGSGEFVNIGSPIALPTTTSGGNNIAEIDLSAIAELQNVAAGTTVEFRVVNYGATGTGSWYINNRSTAGNDLVINGTVEPENPDAPIVEVSPTILPAFSTPQSAPSAAGSFTLTGSNLSGDITVSAPAGYEVSQTAGGTAGYAASQLVSTGSLPATIYVRLTGATAGSFSGNVTASSDGATTQNVAVSGVVLEVAPLTADAAYVQTFSGYSSEFPTLPQGWSMAGSLTTFPSNPVEAIWGNGTGGGLRGSAAVFGYQHVGTTGLFQQILTMRNDTGSVLETVHIRYTGRVARATEGRTPSYAVTVAGVEQAGLAYSTASGIDEIITAEISGLSIPAGAAFQIVWSSDGSATGSPGSGGRRQIGIGTVQVSTSEITTQPDLQVTGAPTPFSTTTDTPSASQAFTLSATNLANGIIITAPAGFEVSLDDVGFGAVIELYPGIDLASTPVYVRLAASASPGSFAGSVTFASTGATTRELIVTGTVTGGGTAYDTWAGSFGLDPTVTTGPTAGAPTADPDGDTFNNAQEYAFGTNPTQGTPSLLTTETSGGDLVVQWLQRGDVTYTPQSTANLATTPFADDFSVTVVDGPVEPAPPAGYIRRQFTVPASGQKFYRVIGTTAAP